MAAATITQLVRVVQQADKMAALEDYLRGVLEKQRGQSGADGAAGAPRAMVFCSTKSACDMLAYKINTWVPGCGGAHGSWHRARFGVRVRMCSVGMPTCVGKKSTAAAYLPGKNCRKCGVI